MINTETLIEEDCITLLDRALVGKDICAFGEDGFGQYGRHERASWFKIKEVDVTIYVTDTLDIGGTAAIYLTGYDSTVTGHIMTDLNFEIKLKELLTNVAISPDALTWQKDASNQGVGMVMMDISISDLLDWA